jgi:putative transposase
MGRKRFIAEQIIVKLREVEIIESKGLTQVEVAKKLGLCEKTLVRLRKELVDQAKRFK